MSETDHHQVNLSLPLSGRLTLASWWQAALGAGDEGLEGGCGVRIDILRRRGQMLDEFGLKLLDPGQLRSAVSDW